MGLWATIFGTPKAVDTAIDTGKNIINSTISGIDYAFFTNEEKQEVAMTALNKSIDTYMKYMETTLNESAARAITRRVIALIVIGNTTLLFDASALLYNYNRAWSTQLLNLAFSWLDLAMLVMFFYFGYYGVKAVAGLFRANVEKKK